jgi:putative DNA primase/helicase
MTHDSAKAASGAGCGLRSNEMLRRPLKIENTATRRPSQAIRRGHRPDILATAQRLGAKLKRTSGEYVGPCPICGGHDRFAVNPRKQLFICRGCGVGGDAVDLVRHVTGASFASAVEMIEGSPPRSPRPPRQPPPTTTENAIRIWEASVDPRGTMVERYLNGRGLELSDDIAGGVIRWNHATQWRGDKRPKAAMVCLMRGIANEAPQAVSLTFLAGDAKTGRIFIGPALGAAVMLDPPEDVMGGLHIGEGVETCMAARQLSLRPAWALGSAGAIAAFPILSGVECLTLLQENDAASERVCEACAARWHAAGREVFINQPTSGKDLNDAIRGPS